MALAANAAVTINEFLTSNGGGLRDEDLETPDWIEIYNSGPGAVNLGGWHLTDDPGDLARWTFPATNLPAGGYLVVFASGKNRANAGSPLHANFQLNNDAEYLALVQPGGTVAHEYSPGYPNQRANVSYGLEVSTITTALISPGATARVLVPTDGDLGTSWTATAFNDAAWTVGNTPVSYEVGVTATPVLSIDVNERVTNAAPVTEAGFSSFVINSNGSATAIQMLPTTRVFGGITVTVSGTGSVGYDDRLRPAPTDSGAFTESLLLRDFLFSQDNSGTNGLDLTIAGLTPNRKHRFTVWGFDSGSSGNRVSDWYANGVLVKSAYTFNGAVLPTSNEQCQFTFDATANGSGQVLLSGRRNLATFSFGVYLNALRIQSLNPQPATNALGTLMLSNNATAYVRIPFNVANPNAFQALRLRMRYDDGFVAHINGQVVASRNAPGAPQWNSSATSAAADSQSLVYEDIDIPNTPGLLVTGGNVLAIHGMNVSAADVDFFILPELQGLATGSIVERYFTPPTPGLNNGAGYLGLVADTKFSVDRGFYSAPFPVSITSATALASIYWTTNGSIPLPTNGTLYTGPISIPGTRLLRAAAFLTNHVPSVPDTHSYIFLSQVMQQPDNPPGYPATWQGGYPADYGMDPNVVNHPNYGLTLSNDLRSIPTLSLVSDHDSFWHPTTGIYVDAVNDRGERATSVELFKGDNTSEFQINCGIQMHGQAGRDNARSPKHSFRLEFKSDYGPSRLDYDWFGGGVMSFDSIILRSTWADTWTTRYDPFSGGSYPWPDDFPLRYRPENATYLRDQWVKEAMRDMGHLASRGSHVHLYVNGLYWGIYNAIERLDTTYFANHLGGYEKDWDIMKDYSELQDGSRADWDNLIALVNLGISSEADFQAVAAQVDMDNLIDFFLLHALVEANDWLQISNPHNWYGAHRRANPANGLPATKWVFLPWDQEIAFNQLRNDDRVNGLSDDPLPSRIYNELRNWPEFRRMYGDRVQKHMFNGGLLSPSNNIARLQALAAEIDRAMVGESARWGDAREFTIGANGGTGQTFTRDEWWIAELQKLYTNWFPNVMHQRTIERLQAAGLYPLVAPPEFSQPGGAISNGFALAISNPNGFGSIYFTVNGADPREYGTGAISGSAQAYSSAILINAPTPVRARVFDGGNWSALVEATFYTPQDLSKLALTEIMYNPPAIGPIAGNNLEFLELKNTGTNTLDLSGLAFSGITFTFTNGTTLGPGQFFVLARDGAAFASKYPGVNVRGTYTGQLDNAGEQIALTHPLGTPVFSVTYDDRPDWPVGPDVADFSLVQTMPGISQAPDKGNRWRASTNPGGSPGADDPAPNIAPIIISEILAHTDPPQKDAIELYNPTATNVNIGGWFLTDEPDTPQKFRIPNNTVINAGVRIFFNEDDFNATPGAPTSFLLSSTGDDVHLFSANTNGTLTGYSHSAVFGASFNGVSFGRYVNSANDEFFSRQPALTLGAANPGPVIGPVVVSEIHYNPAANGDEFVELLNLTGSPVALYHATFPTNAWKLSGVDFTFPTNVTLGANGTLLVVATNPAAFRAKYNVPTNVPIFGPYVGQLQNSGENVELQAPDNPNTDIVPYVTMDAVRYNDQSPWPPAADGSGMSLQRVPVNGYGNEPTNWIAAAPTPGRATGSGDSDGDGLPDSWEQDNGTFVFIPDGNDDPDGDGLTNWQEYLAGTHPQNASSALRFSQITASGGKVTLQFFAVSNRSYSLLYKPSLDAVQWSKWSDIPAHATNRVVNLTNSIPGDASRFYRLVTPQL
ncbi:MAG TPA: lamin tail domain-containing protein [Verrucomicrobiae bacterium]|nr:lamin tail domain-containing protein [Verrucomicrobiae bacterium]